MLCNHDATMAFLCRGTSFGSISARSGARSLTQAAIAEAIGVDRVTYARWETGERKPSVDAISNLAGFFNTSIEALLGTKARKR
jgi:transcriptional regulator with XRE-family HTH domain